MSLKPLIDSLNERHKAITTYDESDWDFFLNVAEYIQSIKESPALLTIITQLKNKNPDQANLEKYKAQALQELEKIKTTLIHRIKKEDNCTENLQNIIIQLENYTGTDPYKLFITLSDAISTLEKKNHSDLIKDLYTIGIETPQVRFYTLSKAYDLFRNEKERIDNFIETEREMGFGIIWNELEIIYFLIFETENYFRQIIKKPNILANEARFLELTAEMKKIKNGSSSKVFQKNKYKQYLIRIHNWLIGEMNKKDDTTLSKKVTEDHLTKKIKSPFLKGIHIEMQVGKLVSYNDGTIRYDGKIIQLRNQIKDLCRMFMENLERIITIDDIKDSIIAADKRKATPNNTMAKYVSELRNSLKTHFKKDVIFNQKEEGWYMKVK